MNVYVHICVYIYILYNMYMKNMAYTVYRVCV